jgi:hypothetical protein
MVTGSSNGGRRTLLRAAAILALGAMSGCSPAKEAPDAGEASIAPSVTEDSDSAPPVSSTRDSGRTPSDCTVASGTSATVWPHTSDLSDCFFEKMVSGCAKMGCQPRELLSVWMNESFVSATAHNPYGDASGLCQFMPFVLPLVGWKKTLNGKPDHAAFRKLTAEEQLPYVFTFYGWSKGYLASATNDYVITFLPAQKKLPEVPTTILTCASPPSHLPGCPPPGIYAYAYLANTSFDANSPKKGAIDRADLLSAIDRACNSPMAKPRWAEITSRLDSAQRIAARN